MPGDLLHPAEHFALGQGSPQMSHWRTETNNGVSIYSHLLTQMLSVTTTRHIEQNRPFSSNTAPPVNKAVVFKYNFATHWSYWCVTAPSSGQTRIAQRHKTGFPPVLSRFAAPKLMNHFPIPVIMTAAAGSYLVDTPFYPCWRRLGIGVGLWYCRFWVRSWL